MAAANRTAQLLEFLTCYSKFIAYLVASQNRNNSFQYVLMRKSTLPQNTTIVTHHQIGQGFFSLPDSAYQKSSCWTATEHTSGLEVPYLQSHEGKQQQIPDATPGDEMGPAACVHRSWLCSICLQQPLPVQFLPQQKIYIPIMHSPVVLLLTRQSQCGNHTGPTDEAEVAHPSPGKAGGKEFRFLFTGEMGQGKGTGAGRRETDQD